MLVTIPTTEKLTGSNEITREEIGFQFLLNGEIIEITANQAEYLTTDDEDFNQATTLMVGYDGYEWEIEITEANRNAIAEILFPE